VASSPVAEALQPLGAMLLVGHDLTRQRRSAIESQMRDRGEKYAATHLAAEFELANDPALVARIIDPCELATRGHIDLPKLVT
jgi:hypothetical protein